MYQYMQFLTKKWRQQGAVIAFTALLLPMLIIGTGLAVDLGHVYVQYSRLQNAADAAALAGAKAYAENNETVDKHPKANAKAEKYIQGEFHNLEDEQREKIEDNYKKGKKDRYKARTKDDITYYRVKLYKEVPLYFLGGIYKTISGKETYTVPVESVAAISLASQPGTSGNSAFPNLFTFTDSFNGINTAQNPDNVKIAEISCTFTGRIVTNNQNSVITYRHQLITNDAREKQKKNSDYTVKNAIDDGYVNDPILDEKIDLRFYEGTATRIGNSSTKNFTENTSQTISAQNHFNSSYISTNNNQSVIHYTSNNGGNISFDTDVAGNKNNPLYIIIDSANNPQINFNADIKVTRPIIYCYLGKGELWINANPGVEFHGIIYAPYAKVGIHENGWKFYGSLVARSFELTAKGDYTYEDFGISNDSGSGSSSGGSNTPATNNSQVKLVSPKSIKWD